MNKFSCFCDAQDGNLAKELVRFCFPPVPDWSQDI